MLWNVFDLREHSQSVAFFYSKIKQQMDMLAEKQHVLHVLRNLNPMGFGTGKMR